MVHMASSKSLTADEQRQWVAQWKTASRALSEQRAKELREMTADQAAAAVSAVLDLATSVPLRPARESHSGLVELQAYLKKLRD
jgi:hypothetical protein